jgi:signal peptide peptidase-like protein 2B
MYAIFIVAYSALNAAKKDNENYRNDDILNSSHQMNQSNNDIRNNLSNSDDEFGNFEIKTSHTFMYAGMSAVMLTLIFYLKIYSFLSIFYVFASSAASYVVLFQPFLYRILNGHESASHVGAIILSVLLAITWSICSYNDFTFIWFPQNIMGFSICVFAISLVKLPNLKVATLLLGMMFFYDIFFVFISPIIFDSSVMIKVASGGKILHDDENFCEKYPKHVDCRKSGLPMLFTFPSMMSYSSDGSMLGLGDVVLPGLLVAFTARLDWRSLGPFRFDTDIIQLWSKGCFFVTMVAYSIGLFLANLAVEIFKQGQPALLYINPLVILAVIIWGWRRGCLHELWIGPAVFYPHVSNVVIVNEGEDQVFLKKYFIYFYYSYSYFLINIFLLIFLLVTTGCITHG